MTNEEKALEMFPDAPTLELVCAGVREKLVEMAVWKDNQFKEFLEKKFNDERNETGVVYGIRAYLLEEIINELFPKTGNDDSENDE